MALVMLAAIMGFYLLGSLLCMSPGDNTALTMAGLGVSLLASLPLWLGAGWLLRFIRRRFPCEDATLVALPGRKPLLTRWRVRETAEEASPHTSAQGGWRQDSAPANNC